MLRILTLALLLCLHPATVRAQDSMPDAASALAPDKVSNETIYVNAQNDVLVPDALRGGLHRLGYIGRLTLTLTTLRLVDQGVLDLDRPIAKYLPDLLEDNPFTVALTLRHILSDTSGYAVPPMAYLKPEAKTAPLANFLIPDRTPGQAASDDPVAWALLVRLLETVGGKPVADLVRDELTAPLGFGAEAITVPADDPAHGSSYLAPVYHQKASAALIAAMARLLILNADKDGKPFLSEDTWLYLTQRPFFRLHPLAPEHMLGTVKLYAGNQAWLAVGGTCVPSPYIMAFPAARQAFVHFPSGDACPHAAFQRTVLALATKAFPPVDSSKREAAAARVKEAKTVGGRYAGADRLSAWTRDRIVTLIADAALLNETADGVRLIRPGRPAADYQKIGPYYYQSATGAPLILSPYRLGGYMLTDGRLYRHVGRFASPTYILTPLPWLLIASATSILYLFNRTDRAWRSMAALGFVGTALIAAGLYGEWVLWPRYVYGADKVWMVTLWRTGLNIGLMFVMTLPLYAASFRRRKLYPERGIGALLAPPHMLILSVAAIGLLFILTAWGLAGSFTGP